ncbi:GntR family transcriptional regulator [Streptomyces sp. NPDC002701]|uniref:GntR family transcriptional regulator n=1 Tax=Streptomyces sp. NPDC002701 TaxID=3364661 RepID=UPI003688482D
MRDDVRKAVRKVAEVLRKEISDGTWKAGTVRASGDPTRRFCTTRYVIHKAVALLRDEGVVETRAGGGGGIAPRGTMPCAWPVGTTRSKAIRRTVRERINAGTYPAGELLPTLTSLSQEFAVAKSTMSAALRPLKAEGLLIPADRRTMITARKGLVTNIEPVRGFDRA